MSPDSVRGAAFRIPLLAALLAVGAAACTPPATVGAEADAGVQADTSGITLLNRAEMHRAMDAAYDPLLRDAGVTGRVHVDLTLNADGSVDDADQVDSTHERFSSSARQVAPRLRFSPPPAAGTVVRVRMEFVYRRPEIAIVRVVPPAGTE